MNKINVYIFEFFKQKDFINIDFEAYAKRNIYELGCRPYMTFNFIPASQKLHDFVYEVHPRLQKFIRSCYLKDEVNYYFLAYEYENEKTKTKQLRCV